MQKVKIVIIIICLAILGLLLYGIFNLLAEKNSAEASDTGAYKKVEEAFTEDDSEYNKYYVPPADADTDSKMYRVFTEETFVESFDNYDEALDLAQTLSRSSVRKASEYGWIWDNYPPYHVFTGGTGDGHLEFETFSEAVNAARQTSGAYIYYRKSNLLVWTDAKALPESYRIENVPLIYQYPELPYGCEIVSLTMLLNYNGIDVDKMTLAEQVPKLDWWVTGSDGLKYRGDPRKGYVGDMYSTAGYGGYAVYNDAVYELAKQYEPYSLLNITGCEPEDLLYFLSAGNPVWVIANATYAELPASSVSFWGTEDGEVIVTQNEHSMVVTGFDEKLIYLNDPIAGRISVGRDNFFKAWRQMGSQAITIVS